MQNQTSKNNVHSDSVSSRGRKKAFESKQGKHLSAGQGKKKSWWKRHTDRLKGIHCDRSMECHY